MLHPQSGRVIEARFILDESVTVKLRPSDGRKMELPQAFGASGVFGEYVLSCVSLMDGYRSAAANKPIAFTGQLEYMALRRLAETTKFGYDVTRTRAMVQGAPGFNAALKVRMMHAHGMACRRHAACRRCRFTLVGPGPHECTARTRGNVARKNCRAARNAAAFRLYTYRARRPRGDDLGLPNSPLKYAVAFTTPAVFLLETLRRVVPGATETAIRLGDAWQRRMVERSLGGEMPAFVPPHEPRRV